MKNLLKIMTNRIIIIVFLIILQLAVLLTVVWRFNDFFVYFYATNIVISIFIVLKIINNRSNPAYKIAWLVPIMLIPIFGTAIYLIFGRVRFKKSEKIKMFIIQKKEKEANERTVTALDMSGLSLDARAQAHYLSHFGESSLFVNSSSRYFPLGEEAFQAMLEEMEKAEKYLFLEYFIIAEGKMWDTILEVMVRKAREGVDVRLMYDDFGCLLTLPHNYDKELERMGIKCCIFNQINPVLSPIFNNRNHRKILVIDGKVAFTGGINLADEYINQYERFGHWKDNAIMVKGEVAWGFTLLFLSLWEYSRGKERDYAYYFPGYEALRLAAGEESQGYYHPYVDSPFDKEDVGMNVYLNLIYRAEKYVYITTPYLVIDNLLTEALTTAAKSGVDVHIITPHIPDKWYVHEVTRSNYARLMESGVRIFEYTPGFIHSKTFVVDGEYATVGTVNLDYRSLYLHFENGIWMYQSPSVQEVLQDHLHTEALSQEMTLEDVHRVSWLRTMLRAVLGVFSPLL
ncbi:cardiolipin synthase [Vagococcus acidifermentans]|uniref:Cardiolipin synthase n=2 Tax=Vagococcus acidifermentans TaxID=564710 RepID=A0A430AVM2_9ENTE|nr:cardiolipin synthase [Vagococcus acidifermentans]